jgi:hypothetical protein
VVTHESAKLACAGSIPARASGVVLSPCRGDEIGSHTGLKIPGGDKRLMWVRVPPSAQQNIVRCLWDLKASAGTSSADEVARAGPRNFCERRRAEMFLAEPTLGTTTYTEIVSRRDIRCLEMSLVVRVLRLFSQH